VGKAATLPTQVRPGRARRRMWHGESNAQTTHMCAQRAQVRTHTERDRHAAGQVEVVHNLQEPMQERHDNTGTSSMPPLTTRHDPLHQSRANHVRNRC
jgi:hypothetical protein